MSELYIFMLNIYSLLMVMDLWHCNWLWNKKTDASFWSFVENDYAYYYTRTCQLGTAAAAAVGAASAAAAFF